MAGRAYKLSSAISRLKFRIVRGPIVIPYFGSHDGPKEVFVYLPVLLPMREVNCEANLMVFLKDNLSVVGGNSKRPGPCLATYKRNIPGT